MTRTQFTFYVSFHEALSRIRKKADRCDAYEAICAYALYGEEPDAEKLSDAAAIAFSLIRPTLDSAAKKAKGGMASSAGKKDPRKTRAGSGKDPGKEKEKEKEGENEKEEEIEKETEKEFSSEREDAGEDRAPAKKPAFVPPDVPTVAAYCEEHGIRADPARFVAYYEANGWRVGKNPMRSWESALRGWERTGVDDGRMGRASAPAPAEKADPEETLRRARRTLERIGGKGT